MLRPRLFDLLDVWCDRHRGIWIQAPPGAGKTLLAASYAARCASPVLWYRMGEEDADPSVFFGNLELLVRRKLRRRAALPAFSPEHLGDVAAFTRAWLRVALRSSRRATGSATGALFILDDVHALPMQAPTLEVLRGLCEELPQDHACLFLSRSAPPAAFEGLIARQALHLPKGELLDFDLPEARRLAQTQRLGAGRLESHEMHTLLALTGGWAAPLAVRLRQRDPVAAARADTPVMQEALQMLPLPARSHLLATCALETVTVDDAVALTDDARAPETFRRLAADCYLVTETAGPMWRVHPLLRVFLVEEVRRDLGEPGLRALRSRSVARLLESDRTSEAAELAIEIGDGPALRHAIAVRAKQALSEGHHLKLLRWIEALPEADRDEDPWLLYWEGAARMPLDPRSARDRMARAHALFGENPLGRLLSSAGALAAILFAWDDMGEVSRWLAELESLDEFRRTANDPELDAAVAILAEALPVAARNDYLNLHPFWQPEPVARLCALALERGLEPDYVRRLIERRGLLAPPEADETWPWPVRIRTFGGFRVEVGGRDLVRSSKGQQKPLQLLQSLVAMNPDGTATRVLADHLWPDSDADAAWHSLEVTISRLRRSLGRPDAVGVGAGVLRLDRRVCWVDRFVLDDVLRRLEDDEVQIAPEVLVRRLLRVYAGDLLPGVDEPWILVERQRISARFVRAIEQLGTLLEARGGRDVAIEAYRRALEIDPVAETLCRRLMEALAAQGRQTEALAVYEHCFAACHAHLGAAPSSLTQSLGQGLRTQIPR